MSLPVDSSLLPFFEPKGIVLVGASRNPMKLGFGLARNLVQSGYEGAIHFVNPGGGTLLERPLYPQISHVPNPVDLAVLLVPAPAMPQAIADCGERGIRAAILAAGGFRETGAAGAALEQECLRVAQQFGIRLIGPNCIGLLDTHLPLDTTFLPPPGPTPGAVAFISHSGAICAAVIDWARGQGFGLSRLVSLGNQLDVQETDVLAAVAADPHTRVVTLYLEGVSDGRRFVQVAQQVSREKPALALKVGRFASGQRAVASHTGALAGEESAFDAAFARAGVMRAETSEELFDWAKALAWCPLPQGRRVAVLTNAGGPGVTAADALEAHNLELATVAPETEAALRNVLPAAASFQNPVDMLAGASPEQYATCLRILLEDGGVDSVMVILPPPPMYSAGGVAKAMLPIIYATGKPVVIALMGEKMIQEAVEHFRAAKVPEYRFPERAAAALAILSRRAEFLQTACTEPERPSPTATAKAQQILANCDVESGTFLPTAVCQELLAAYDIPVPGSGLATTADEAVAIARQVGLPVALKIASADVPHKSDVGGVVLNVRTETAVSTAFTKMMMDVQTALPHAKLDGVLIQPMIPDGQEVIVGVVRDPQFGPVLMFGSGGVEVEGLKDVAFALAPLTQAEAKSLLQNTWAGRKLAGYRNVAAGDETAVLQTILRLGQLAADCPQLAEIEINPLRVLPTSALALDVRARLDSAY
ncbi:acetate--CoA ligase family protein [Candidatus Leptofilum sp.]|uniref:acetate--CoA ligase family protein n=1 Tax=Candidatus Leptofilum sp. TaxID=3241576 RepID=UPI003B5B2E41